MARRERIDRYDVIGGRRRARRFAVVCGEWRSGLYREIHQLNPMMRYTSDSLLSILDDLSMSE